MTSDTPHGAGVGHSRVQSDSPLLGGSPAATPVASAGFRARIGLAGVARRTLGISMLMVTVFLWTASNFLASFIFSDNTYSKPFFMVYLNTSVFALSLIPMGLSFLRTHGARHTRWALYNLLAELREDVRDQVSSLARRGWTSGRRGEEDDAANKLLEDGEGVDGSVRRRHRGASNAGLLRGEGEGEGEGGYDSGCENDSDSDLEAAAGAEPEAPPPGMTASMILAAGGRYDKLTVRQTTWLSLEFSMLWFSANYLAVACLEHTSVASATIFTSLSSMFTLLFCAVSGVEAFTLRKLVGVVASVVGIALVSSIDLSGKSDENRGQFPHKSPAEIAAGDAMALLSAVVYGAYVTVMKQRVGHEDRVNMPLFFGLVGLFNVVLLWPGFVLLHLTGVEPFEPPPTNQVWAIILLNSLSSFASDLSWAYAMLLTTPLVVTVGLSLTIPLSLVGEMIQYSKYSSGLYWVGAFVVVLSFLFVNHESHDPDESLLEEDPATR
ncbi:hypothetical protein HMPREF1624_07871 [Sporothrix schenckii ATCC 58251]|uniref:DUF3955 domain-containing protein n=1 Tax=Sporothrix schenckii (strain ATCC 58251 / de Perez 2211183) TaxID=1391915 RepID=U7PMQ3_SPOS1|nr:hypothetical protein HMPREF1624_07871 [Sporothrix schenckii ATCC 58251]